MGVELYFSNQLRQLGMRLSVNLLAESYQNRDVFQPATIIVPNSNLKKWLQMEIAGNSGVAINLDFKFLETGLWDLLGKFSGKDDDAKLLDDKTLQLMILFLLKNVDEDCSSYDLIRNYVLADGQQQGADYAKRIWQLSGRLAFYFREYEYHRPEMIKEWQAVNGSGMSLPAMEDCQRYLYNRLFARDNGLCSCINEKKFFTLTQYANEIMRNHGGIEPRDKSSNIKSVYIFGLSQVSIFHQHLIGFLGKYYNIHIFAFNPCREFWEDVDTQGEQKWKNRKNAKDIEITKDEMDEGELRESDNLLLQWWGKPGRENIKLLSDLTGYNFHELYCLNEDEDVDNDSVLQRLQRHIFCRIPEGDERYRPVSQDCSIQFAACPGIVREVETVYNSIIYNMEMDKSLNLTDIAILTPDMRKYKTAITSVFNRNPRHISYNLVDSTADRESIFGQAVIGLLKLAEGSFSRREVFAVLYNPCFQDKFSISRDDVQVWANWADELNIFNCFDSEDKKRRGYGENSEHTWQHGLTRLRMSRIMDLPRNPELSGKFKNYRGVIPFDISCTDSTDLVGKFCEVIELLFAGIKRISGHSYSCNNWINLITSLIDAFLDIPDEYQSENHVRKTLLESLQTLEIYDEVSLTNNNVETEQDGSGDGCLNLEIVIELVQSRLTAIQCSYGSYLTGGVTISEMQPMRPIPFRIVYVTGMGEGGFPGKANQSTLDLRLAKRRIGDINKPESNCYMFLEILASTRGKLYFTYVSKDLQKDEEFIPCSVVHQLKQYIESEILPDQDEFKITEVPLKGSSKDYLSSDVSSFSDVLVNYSQSDRLSYYLENGLFEKVKGTADKKDIHVIRKYEPDYSCDRDDGNVYLETEKITLDNLKRFILSPADVSIKRNLNLYDDDTNDKSIAEDEPFYSGFPMDYKFVINALEYFTRSNLDNGSDINAVREYFDNYYKDSLLKGKTPETGFSDRDKWLFVKILDERIPALAQFLEQSKTGGKRYQWIFLGEGNSRDMVYKNEMDIKIAEQWGIFNPLQMDLALRNNDEVVNKRVDIHGSLPVVWQDDTGWHTIVITSRSKPESKFPGKYCLGPFLFYLALLLIDETTELFSGLPFTVHVLYGEKHKSWRYIISAENATNYLRELVVDFLNEKQFDLLPFEVVSDVCKKYKVFNEESTENDPGIKNLIKQTLEDEIASNVELSDLIRLSGTKVPEDAFDIIIKRYELFFNAEELN